MTLRSQVWLTERMAVPQTEIETSNGSYKALILDDKFSFHSIEFEVLT